MTDVPFNTHDELIARGYRMVDAPINILCYDPAGDGDDNDALVMVSREEWRRGELYDPDLSMEFMFRVLMAKRMPTDWDFPDKVAGVLRVNKQMLKWQAQGLQHAHVIGVETNGVGYAMGSTLKSKTNTPIFEYVTVGKASDQPFEAKRMAMPRLAALDNLRVLLELQRLRPTKDCEGIADLRQEMNSFVWKRPGRPEAMEGTHDDLVMALAGACWIGTKLLPPITKQVKIDPRSGIQEHNRRTSGNIRLN